MHNITEKTEHPCSGCGACAAVCPANAVTLALDAAGFYRAAVDASLCVDCGLCQKVCTRFTAQTGGVRLYDAPLFALQSADAATVQRCSSGGLAHELARQALAEGMQVAGVVYDTATDRAKHVLVDRPEDLAALDGSKYLQSDPAVFRRMLAEAKADPAARFAVFGTPCQITGLARAAELAGVRERFLLTEIFCHGVPSYRVWEQECARLRKKLHAERFDAVQFRYKKADWHSYCLRVDAGERTFYGARETEPFYRVYFENVLLNDACLTCRMRKESSCADFRLGDYWGRRFAARRDGVSAVYCLTDRARGFSEKLPVKALTPGTAAEQLRYQNMAGYTPSALHTQAMDVLRTQGAAKAIRYYRRRSPVKVKVKGALLTLLGLLPDRWRAALKRYR